MHHDGKKQLGTNWVREQVALPKVFAPVVKSTVPDKASGKGGKWHRYKKNVGELHPHLSLLAILSGHVPIKHIRSRLVRRRWMTQVKQ